MLFHEKFVVAFAQGFGRTPTLSLLVCWLGGAHTHPDIGLSIVYRVMSGRVHTNGRLSSRGYAMGFEECGDDS